MTFPKFLTNSEHWEAVVQYIPEDTLVDYTVHSIWTKDDSFVNDLVMDVCDDMLGDHAEGDCALLLKHYQPVLDQIADELRWPLKALMKNKDNRRFMPMYFNVDLRRESLTFTLVERDPEDFDESEEEE